MKKQNYSVGDIFQIPLPNGKYSFARLYKLGGMAFYEGYYTSFSQLPENESYLFIVTVYDYVLNDGEWKVVGHRPFDDEELAYPPPRFMKDQINGKYSIYDRGVIRPATREECKGLEATAVWGRNHIVDRLMGDKKWNITL